MYELIDDVEHRHGLMSRLRDEYYSRRNHHERISLGDIVSRCPTRSERLELLQTLLPDEIARYRGLHRRDPCCEELCVENPSISVELAEAYELIEESYRYLRRAAQYRIVSVLSDDSAQAIVVKGRHDILGRDVAVKYSRREADRPRLQYEARILERLRRDDGQSHPHIVHSYDCIAVEGRTCLILEHLAGASLSKAHRPGKSADVALVARVGEQVADALSHCHGRGIYHCDLSPNNILLVNANRAVLIDFGLAVDQENGPDRRFPLPDLGGTREFFPPERLCDEMRCWEKADIYSLAAVLHWMLTGDTPPQTSAASSGKFPPLPAVPRSLRPTLARALAANPDDRYQNAQEFGDALRNWRRRTWKSRTLALVTVAVAATFAATLGIANLPASPIEAQVGERIAKVLEDRLASSNATLVGLINALSRVDMTTLATIGEGSVAPTIVESALAAPSLGTRASVAADFFAETRHRPEAIDWLRDRIREGVDPNLIIEHKLFERSLLSAALQAGNKRAACMLLDEGANPHPYERVLGRLEHGHTFLYPFGRLDEMNFTPDEKREIAEKMLRCGAVVPKPRFRVHWLDREPIPPYQLGERVTCDAQMAEKSILLLGERWGLPCEPTPTIHEGHRSPIVERAASRGGHDWKTFMAMIPYRIVNKPENGSHMVDLVTAGHVISIHGDAIYFMGEAIVASEVHSCIIQSDSRGAEWLVYLRIGLRDQIFGARGWPYTSRGEMSPNDYEHDDWYRRLRFVVDPEARSAELEGYHYDVCYTPEQLRELEDRRKKEKAAAEAREAAEAARNARLEEEQRVSVEPPAETEQAGIPTQSVAGEERLAAERDYGLAMYNSQRKSAAQAEEAAKKQREEFAAYVRELSRPKEDLGPLLRATGEATER